MFHVQKILTLKFVLSCDYVCCWLNIMRYFNSHNQANKCTYVKCIHHQHVSTGVSTITGGNLQEQKCGENRLKLQWSEVKWGEV